MIQIQLEYLSQKNKRVKHVQRMLILIKTADSNYIKFWFVLDWKWWVKFN